MIKCTIELIPHGNESRREQIGMIEITNDLSGNLKQGSYRVLSWYNVTGKWIKDFCREHVVNIKHNRDDSLMVLLNKSIKAILKKEKEFENGG